MPDVRELMEALVVHPVAPALPIDEIKRRARMRRARRRTTFAVVAVMALVAGPVRWAASDSRTPVRVTSEPGEDAPEAALQPSAPPAERGSEGSRTSSTAAPSQGHVGHHPGMPAQPALQCKRGANGGRTDVGVTDTKIHVLMRATLDGPAKTLAEDAPVAVKTVVDRVNRDGGICGRLIDVRVVNDTAGRTWSQEGTGDHFAGLVGPLQAGLDEHILNRTIDRLRMPMVGTDGLTAAQYDSEFVWPVGPSGAVLSRIAVDHAYRTLGARSFAMVYDSVATWSTDAVAAFRSYVERLPGASVRVTVGLDPSEAAYSGPAHAFNQACKDDQCDVVVLALLPETAKKWLQAGPAHPRLQLAGLLFQHSEGFGVDCARQLGNRCDGFRVWLGYSPRQGANPLVQGATVGAEVLVEALKRMGPQVTRERLQGVLAEMTYRSDLVHMLDWNPASSGNRGGNTHARAVDAHVEAGAFRTFEDAGTGWVKDPA